MVAAGRGMSGAAAAAFLWAHLVAATEAGPSPDLSGRRRYKPTTIDIPMPNVQDLEQLEAFWDLPGHKKPALLIQELIVEYKPFLWRIRPKIAALVRAFRAAGLPIFWSSWWRLSPQLLRRMGKPGTWSRNHTNELDRLFGPLGVVEGENGNFLYQDHGWEILPEIAPATEEERRRVQLKWRMDCFAESRWAVPAGQKDLASELRGLGVDLVVNTGVWTDACVVATAFGAMNKDFDLVTVSDAVDTVTTGHHASLYVIQGAAGKVCDTATVLDFVGKTFLGEGAPGGSTRQHSESASASVLQEAVDPPAQQPRQESGSPTYFVPFFVTWTLLCLMIGYAWGSGRLRSRSQKPELLLALG